MQARVSPRSVDSTAEAALPVRVKELARKVNSDIVAVLGGLDEPLRDTLRLLAKETKEDTYISFDNLVKARYSSGDYTGDGVEQFKRISREMKGAVDELAKLGLVQSQMTSQYEDGPENIRTLNLTLSGKYAGVLLTAKQRMGLGY